MLRILIADDNSIVRDALKRLLRCQLSLSPEKPLHPLYDRLVGRLCLDNKTVERLMVRTCVNRINLRYCSLGLFRHSSITQRQRQPLMPALRTCLDPCVRWLRYASNSSISSVIAITRNL
jgi:hypothetical protein